MIEQTTIASQLVDELRLCGHDISLLDLLDCLASTELMLVPDHDGVSFFAYYSRIDEPIPMGTS